MSNNLTIGIIGAMDCEVSALKQKLENLEEIKHCNLQINLGTFCGHKIVLVKSGIGKVNAALCTQYIIDKFNPDYIINTTSKSCVNNIVRVNFINNILSA